MKAKFLQGLLAIEFFVDANNVPKNILDHKEVNQLNQTLVKDLVALIPTIDQSSMALIGALYQSNEILQPGFPIHKQLRHYINASLKAANFSTNQLLIGAHKGKLPEGFNPPSNKQKSAMFYLPFTIKTEHAETVSFFEEQLMHKGMASNELLIELQNRFGAKIRHANFMSVLDLSAMIHNHMQMAGFDPLWRLLEQSLFNPAPECKEETNFNNVFYLSKKMVFTPFFSEHFWLNQLNLDVEEYPKYLFTQRQYVNTLLDHGLDVRQFLPDSWPMDESHICFASLNQKVLSDDFFKEEVIALDYSIVDIIPKEHPQLGIMYIQVNDEDNGVENYYPLTEDGIEKINSLLGL